MDAIRMKKRLWRTGDVLEYLGISKKALNGLVECGVLRVFVPRGVYTRKKARVWRFFWKDEVVKLAQAEQERVDA